MLVAMHLDREDASLFSKAFDDVSIKMDIIGIIIIRTQISYKTHIIIELFFFFNDLENI
jgi:hypothetical protein